MFLQDLVLRICKRDRLTNETSIARTYEWITRVSLAHPQIEFVGGTY